MTDTEVGEQNGTTISPIAEPKSPLEGIAVRWDSDNLGVDSSS